MIILIVVMLSILGILVSLFYTSSQVSSFNTDYAYRNECELGVPCGADGNGTCEHDQITQANICAGSYTSTCGIGPNHEDLVECELSKNTCSFCSKVQWKCSSQADIIIDNKKIILPAHPAGDETMGYCLPVVDTVTCNSDTSDAYISTEEGSEGEEYAWKCGCKNPKMFAHQSTNGSNCVMEKACGKQHGLGQLYVVSNPTPVTCSLKSDCGGDEECCDKDDVYGSVCHAEGDPGITNGVCHAKWNPEVSSTAADGKCLCEKGYTYQGSREAGVYSKTCVPDICAPNGRLNRYDPGHTDSITCKCDDSFIACQPGTYTNRFLASKCKTNPECLVDPCKPGGVFNPTTNKCECAGKYINKVDPLSSMGNVCVPACENPLCGDRGTCYKDIATGADKCKCKCPWTGDNCDILTGKKCRNEQCGTSPTAEPRSSMYDKNCYEGLTCKRNNKDRVKSAMPNWLSNALALLGLFDDLWTCG